jgi:hypothetical protein
MHRHDQRRLRSSAVASLTAIIDAIAATLPVELDADIAQGIIEKIGVGKIVRRDKRTCFDLISGLRREGRSG